MICVDDISNENIKDHDPNLARIADHSYRILIVDGSRSRKVNALVDLKYRELDIDKMYL